MRELNYRISAEQKVVGFTAALVVLAGLGPFGTYDAFPLTTRISYWSMLILGVGLLVEFANYAALNSHYLRKLSVPACQMIGVTFATVPAASCVIFVDQGFREVPMDATQLPRLCLQVFFLSYAIMLIDYYLWRRLFAKPSPTFDDTPTSIPDTPKIINTKPRLFTKLPPDAQNSEIISMSMQDHYVEVTTNKGAHLLLMRLSDAIVLLDNTPGSQIHRSHWAAAPHMTSLNRDGQKAQLTLSNGRMLPVSTRYVEQVQTLLDPT